MTTNELMERLNYEDTLAETIYAMCERDPREFAIDLWRRYPEQTKVLLAALYQTQHTRKLPALVRE
jgi:hypothetical protein